MNKETISALATPVGGAIAVIRLSGPDAIGIADSVFSKDLTHAKANTLHYGEIRNDNGETIDDVVVSVYRAPHSYTGEDSIEISCHGSAYIVRQILLLLQKHGSRQAGPGEYTRRAYLNGKMDLSQAEAVADIIAASSKTAHDLAVSQLKGHVRTALEGLRERLQKLTALLELELDFSDHEDLEFADRGELNSLADDISKRLNRIAETYRAGKAIKEGIPVAIVGRTNVGKSTLLNCFLGEDRAIVSDIPGTTRDSIEDTITIGNLSFRFIDTAGLRHTTDRVEQIGIQRAYGAIDRAAIVLWVTDEKPTDEESQQMLQRCEGKKLIVVANKSDLTGKQAEADKENGEGTVANPIRISAKNGNGIDELKEALLRAADIPQLHEGDTVITSARQYGLLSEASENLQRVIDGLHNGLPSDLVAEDLRMVLDNLADITGIERISPKTTLDLIFKSYCIGK